eukprot:471198_1
MENNPQEEKERAREEKIKKMISELRYNEDTYWGKRVKSFINANPDNAFEKLKEALTNEAAAWSVFAALLMTVGAAALTVNKGDYQGNAATLPREPMSEFVSFVYVFTNSLSFGLSFLGVIVGTQNYSYYNNLPAEMMDIAIKNCKQMNVSYFIYVAVISQGIGVTAGVNLLFQHEYWLALVVAVFCIIMIFVSWWLDRQSDKANEEDAKAKKTSSDSEYH